MRTQKLKNQIKKGFTLIEVLIVLGIAAIVAAAAYFTYNSVRTTNDANEEIRNLDIIRSGIQNMYASQRDYTGLTLALVSNSGIVPSNLVGAGTGAIQNKWGNAYTITATGPDSGPSKSFGVTTTVPKNACEKVSQGLVAAWDYVAIGGAATNVPRPWATNQPVNATQILTGCAAGAATVQLFLGAR